MRRGFTLAETVVTLVVAGTLSGAAIYITTRNSAPGSETQAQSAVWSGWQAQVNAESTGQAPADASTLAAIAPGGSWTAGESDGDGSVSVAVAGTAAYLASEGPDGSCWVARYDSRPGGPLGSRHIVWAIILPEASIACDSRLEALQDRMDGIANEEWTLGTPKLIQN